MATKCPTCQTENPETQQFCGQCGTQLIPSQGSQVSKTLTLETPAEGLTRGTVFAGRYEILEELGTGGMGNVYRVFDRKLEEEVALKLIRPDIAASRKTIDRFKNEIKVARKITHPSVCRMHDLHEEEKTLYITMEYVRGEDLKSVIHRMGTLTMGKAVSIAHQVAAGMAEAHKLGIIHRDLKPGNIMIDKEGNAKIMDFGIARILAATGTTAEGSMIGTPEYMSPEQVEGKPADARSDLYALGVILFEMVTGQAPFEGDTPLSIAHKHRYEPPPDPQKLNSHIPNGLNRSILRLLEKDREKRYQTTDDLIADLTAVESVLPIGERITPKRRPSISREITVKFSPRKLIIPAAAVVFCFVALLIWRFLPKKADYPNPSGKPSLAVLYFENVSGDKSLDVWKTGLTQLLITDLYQSRLINVLSYDRVYGILKKLGLEEANRYATEDLNNVADEGKVDHIVYGSILKAGESIIFTLTLQKPHSGELVESIRVVCQNEAAIIAKVDGLTNKIKAGLGISAQRIASDIDMEAAKIMTSSPEALIYFLEGDEYLNFKYDYQKAKTLYEKAIEIDPQFARVYIGLAVCYRFLGDPSKELYYRQKAFDLRNRLSERESLYVEANLYIMAEKTFEKAIRVYDKYFELYPDDAYEIMSLGIVYYKLEEWEKAQAKYELACQIEGKGWNYFGRRLFMVYSKLGLYDKAEKTAKDYLASVADEAGVHFSLGSLHVIQGNFDLALSEIEKGFLLDPQPHSELFRGRVRQLGGELSEAERIYLRGQEYDSQMWRRTARLCLCSLYLLQGEIDKGKDSLMREIEPGGDLDEGIEGPSDPYIYIFMRMQNPEITLSIIDDLLKQAVEEENWWMQRYALWWKGIVLVEHKRLAEAERAAQELKDVIQKGIHKKAIRLYNHLVGKIALEKGEYVPAIKSLNKAWSLQPSQENFDDDHIIYLYPLAEAFYRSGNLERAKIEFEAAICLTTGRFYYGDLFAKSFYMLGKIAEEQGEKGRAIENFRKFLDLWKEADAGMPEVEDARKRLAEL